MVTKQSNTNTTIENEKQTIIEATNADSKVEINVSSDTIVDVDISDFEHLSAGEVHSESHHNPSPHENLFSGTVRNEMLIQYNHIAIGSFKEYFQHVDTNNLAEVLKALRELKFVLANRAPELASYFNMELKPRQITAEEVPNLVRAHFNHQYQGTINILKGQTIIFIQTEITVTHTTILIVNIIHPILLGTPLA